MEAAKRVSIADCCRVGTGIVVTFSNGEYVLFHDHFLWGTRDDDGNRHLVDEGNWSDDLEPVTP